MAKARKKRRPPEPVPVLSGRLLIAAGLLAAMLIFPFTLNRLVTPSTPGPAPTDVSQWGIGKEANVRITLITADFNLLSCASEQAVEGKHCAYKTETTPWPPDPAAPIDDNKATLIQPYRTFPDNKLILVAGLWADPTMALRLHREPSAGVRPEKLARFVANCKVRFTGKLDKPKLRWAPGQAWQLPTPQDTDSEGKVFVAEPVSCELTDN